MNAPPKTVFVIAIELWIAPKARRAASKELARFVKPHYETRDEARAALAALSRRWRNICYVAQQTGL